MSTRTPGSGLDGSGGAPPAGELVEVFWRPGCPYCSKLRRELNRRCVSATWRNIWDDAQAREIVRSANSGNETVPTVRIGTRTLTNPSWRALASLLGDGAWQLEASPSLRLRSMKTTASWLPVALLVLASLVLTVGSHDGVAWAAGALAVAAWWFTRRLRG